MSSNEFRHRRLIVKADDFGRGPLVDCWRRFVDVCLDVDIAPSIGIVAGDFQRNRPAQEMARYLNGSLGVEFWNHSYSHRDLNKMSQAERLKDTRTAQDVIQSVIGARPSIYGAPFNAIDQQSAEDVNSVGDFAGLYFADDIRQAA